MNNFKTIYDGGLPLTLNDFRWVHEGILEAFKVVLSTHGVTDQEAIIISGCERSEAGGIITINEGYVSIGGEPCHVLEHTYPEPTGSNVEYWAIETSSDALGTKVFQDTNTNETYEVRKGVISVGSSVPPGHSSYEDSSKYYWKELVSQNISSPTLLNGSYAVNYRKDLSGFIRFDGKYHTGEDPGTGAVNVLVGTLPVGFRPSSNLLFTLSTINTGTVGNSMIQVGSDGEVRIKIIDAGFVNLLEFNQIPPFRPA